MDAANPVMFGGIDLRRRTTSSPPLSPNDATEHHVVDTARWIQIGMSLRLQALASMANGRVCCALIAVADITSQRESSVSRGDASQQ